MIFAHITICTNAHNLRLRLVCVCWQTSLNPPLFSSILQAVYAVPFAECLSFFQCMKYYLQLCDIFEIQFITRRNSGPFFCSIASKPAPHDPFIHHHNKYIYGNSILTTTLTEAHWLRWSFGAIRLYTCMAAEKVKYPKERHEWETMAAECHTEHINVVWRKRQNDFSFFIFSL